MSHDIVKHRHSYYSNMYPSKNSCYACIRIFNVANLRITSGISKQMGVENISTFFNIAVRDLKNQSGIVHIKKKIVPLQVSNLKSITTTNKDYE